MVEVRFSLNQKYKLFGLLLCVVVCLSGFVGFTIGQGASPNFSDYYLDQSVAPYSYMICTDGAGWYWAVNGSNGAVCYESVNFSSVMQSSINALGVGGGEIFVSNPLNGGVYSALNTIYVYPNVTISGENKRGTVISKNFNGDLFVFLPFDESYEIGFVVIRDLCLFGNRTNFPTGIGINDTLKDSHIDRCYVNNFATGIYINGNSTATTYYNWVSDCHIEFNTVGIWVCNSTNVFIQDNVIAEQYGDGVNINGTYAYNIKFQGNTVKHNGFNGVNAAGNGQYSIYNDNVFSDNGWNQSNVYRDLRLYGGGAYQSIVGNMFYIAASVAYPLEVYTYSPSRTTIVGNVFYQSGVSGVIKFSDFSAGFAGAEIYGNTGYVVANSFSGANTTAISAVLNHGLYSTAKYVWCSFNDSAITGYTWSSTSTQVTITPTGVLPASWTVYVRAEYEP